VTSSRPAEEDVQATRLILETDPGERVMRLDFCAGLLSLVFGSLKHDHRHTPGATETRSCRPAICR
jgi:phage baseplate assembly protein W